MSAAAQITLSAVALGITFWVVRLVGLRQAAVEVRPAVARDHGAARSVGGVSGDRRRGRRVSGVNYAPALLFSFSSLLLLGIVIHYSWELSRLESRTRRLGEEIALLNERLDDAERADDGEDES